MDNQVNPDLDMLEALLATMQQNSGGNQLYDEVDDDDDDEYDDDDEDEDDDQYYEHNIQAMLNPYAGNEQDGAGNMANMQTMNLIQGLLNMNGGGGMAPELEAAIGGSMGGMGGIPQMESSSGFPNMQSLLPNMNQEMAGALAGAFAGGMSLIQDYAGNGANLNDDFDDEDDGALSDEEDDEDDDDLEDDEDDDDEDDVIALRNSAMMMSPMAMQGRNIPNSAMPPIMNRAPVPAGIMPPVQSPSSSIMPSIGTSAGLMAGMLAGAGLASSLNFKSKPSPPMLPYPKPETNQPGPPMSQIKYNTPTTVASSTDKSVSNPVTAITAKPATTSLVSMSGGTVSKVDPLAALAGVGGVALGANIFKPIMSTLGHSGGTAVLNKMDSPGTIVGSQNALVPTNRSLVSDIGDIAKTLAATKISSTNYNNPQKIDNDVRLINPSSPRITEITDNKVQKSKLDCDDDKASLGSSAGSMGSGGGKSDTESVGKKTPPPGHEGTESTHDQGGSCASITDLASATESMRDSDTDNHSESHNIHANLSDVDSELDQRKTNEISHFPALGHMPYILERPMYGWGSIIGLDTAKKALRDLFHTKSFPAVFDGTENSGKGILLFGPSGSGKTSLSRALGKEVGNAIFIGINSSFLYTNHPYEAIKLVRCMFEQARHHKPAVILFDEIDALSCHPSVCKEAAFRAKEEIIAQMRGMTTMQPLYPPNSDPHKMNESILVLGTTNKPWLVDDHLRRLFAYNIHVKLPSDKERYIIFKTFLELSPHGISDQELGYLVSKSEGFSAAEIHAVINQTSHKLKLANPNSLESPLMCYDDIASEITQFGCCYNEDLKIKYSNYIKAATHRKEELDELKDKKDKAKGVKKFSQFAKSIAAAVLSVID